MGRIAGLLCVVVSMAVFLWAPATCAENPSIPGFGLYRSNSAAWAWSEVPKGVSVTPATTESEHYTLLFSIPRAALPGMDPEKATVALVSGPPGSEAKIRVSKAQPYPAMGAAPSPATTPIIAQASLIKAALRCNENGLNLELEFDAAPALRSPWDLYLLLDVDGDAANGFGGADYLLQDCTLNKEVPGTLDVAWFELHPGIVLRDQAAELSAWIQNNSSEAVRGVTVKLNTPEAISVKERPEPSSFDLRPKEAKKLTWSVSSAKTGLTRITLQAGAADVHASAMQWLSVVNERDPKHEYESSAGAWQPYPARPTLQLGNSAPLAAFKTQTSAQLKQNLFGITTHLPRSTNDEDPFAAPNAVDGDPGTCWASRWWRIAVPREPEYLQIDLGAVASASEVRLLPAWKNSGMPACFTISASEDGRHWRILADETDYSPREAPENDPLRAGTVSWQRFPFAASPLRYVRLEATRLTQGGTSFFCAPFEPFQLRVAEMAVLDASGKNLAVSQRPPRVSSTHAAWYNSPDTVQQTWPFLLASGVKLNRIGQWGDKVDWAAVEKTKGIYQVDPEVDRSITESVNAGVDIVLTLAYGNNLYQTLNDSPDFGPTWHRGHPFLQCAPTSPEALTGFANYCAFMAEHFRGRIKYFEIWNEENGWFFDSWKENGSVNMVRAYGRALAVAAQTVKKVNPSAKVLFGGMAGSSLDFPRLALAEGAGPYIDIVAFHPYGHPTPEAAPPTLLTEVDGKMDWRPRPPEIKNYEDEIAAYRKLLRGYNPNMEIWADEMNWFAPGEPAKPEMGDQSELAQAKHLARFFALNAWLGCGAVWWSLYNANGIQEWALLRSGDLTPRAAYYSAGYVSTLLDAVHGVADAGVEVSGVMPPGLMVKTYRNSLGESMVGLWRSTPADDACQPVPVTLRLPGMPETEPALMDTLYGYTQKALLQPADGGVLVPGILVGDWPTFVCFKASRPR